MRVITWNCNMAFRKKYHSVLNLKPDLLVIQECENESRLGGILEELNYNQIIWYGNNPNKGLAVISFNDITIKLSKNFNSDFEYILPIEVNNQSNLFHLYAIWAMPHKEGRLKSYVGQIWGAVIFYKKLLSGQSILIGDFNSNAFWDKERKTGNHSDVVELLSKKNISSIYHSLNKIDHGKEEDPTLYLLKKITKPYHMDYCFASINMIGKNTSIKVGKYDDWIKLSDHMPLLIDNLKLI